MMHMHILNQSTQTLGGGFIFLENLKKGSKGKCKFVDRAEDSHACLAASCTMCTREMVNQAKSLRKKFIFRIDNMPKDSRNRGTAFSRMKDFAKMADVIVFQSEWAREYVGGWLERNHGVNLENSQIIYNGVETEYFNHSDDPATRGETYLFTTYNTDENKRFPEAAYDFHLRTVKARKEGRKEPTLRLVGNFGKEMPNYKFDFFDGEKVSYSPPISDRKKMADEYRSCRYLYFPAFADASPNTVGEGVACGCEVLLSHPIGGTQEVIREYKKKVVSIQDMADKYLALVR